jgi:hypothetical protein
MSGQEDFGPLLDMLLGCVGVLDIISVIALAIKPPPRASKKFPVDVNNNDVTSLVREKTPISGNGGSKAIPMLVVDGTIKDEDDVIESLVSKVNELEAKVIELEVRSREASMERFLDTERYRRSRSPSPYAHHDSNSNDSDDEFRRTIKRSSKGSSLHETRDEELARLTELETEEMSDMNDFVPIVYSTHAEGDDDAPRTIDTCSLDDDVSEENEHKQTMEVTAPQPVDINENFIEMEKQQSHAATSKVLTKQDHIESAESPGETSDVEIANVSREIIEELMTKIDAKMDEQNSQNLKAIDEDFIKKDNFQLLENFPKLNEFPSEELSIIPPIEHETAVEKIENVLETVNIEPPEIILKSPASEDNDDILIEKIEEIHAKDVKQPIEVFDESASSSLRENEGVSLPSTALENVEYFKYFFATHLNANFSPF